jgi:hypothetical protein
LEQTGGSLFSADDEWFGELSNALTMNIAVTSPHMSMTTLNVSEPDLLTNKVKLNTTVSENVNAKNFMEIVPQTPKKHDVEPTTAQVHTTETPLNEVPPVPPTRKVHYSPKKCMSSPHHGISTYTSQVPSNTFVRPEKPKLVKSNSVVSGITSTASGSSEVKKDEKKHVKFSNPWRSMLFRLDSFEVLTRCHGGNCKCFKEANGFLLTFSNNTTLCLKTSN